MNKTNETVDIELEQRHSENTPGPWYVNDECIICDACFETAPDHFRLSEYGDRSIVYKQPQTAEETERCEEAMDGCPVGSIIREEEN